MEPRLNASWTALLARSANRLGRACRYPVMPGQGPKKQWLTPAALMLTAAGIATAACQARAEATDRRRYPPPGRMVNVGGRSLHLIEMGSGSPPVVIVQALGGNVLDFLGFYRELASEMH